jgi:hypothetical protein
MGSAPTSLKIYKERPIECYHFQPPSFLVRRDLGMLGLEFYLSVTGLGVQYRWGAQHVVSLHKPATNKNEKNKYDIWYTFLKFSLPIDGVFFPKN